jgi:hypothetical protein
MSGQIEVRISQDGSKIKVEGKGMTGEGCLEDVKKFISEAGSVTDQELKPSYYDTETHQVDEEL